MSRDYDAFISYTRQQGAQIADRVLDLLKHGHFKVWQDRTHMRGGDDFWRQIESAIEQSRYLVMVLTPDAFAGDRLVLRDEWLTARRRGCQVLPVYSRAYPIDFSDPSVPAWLKKLDCYDLDNDNHREKLINDLRRTPQLRPVPHNVEFPSRFVPREREMRQIVEALCTNGGGRVAITTAIQGAGGFGKTTLAKAVCFEDAVLTRYTDGVVWITVGEGSRREADLLTGLLAQLGQTPKSADPEALFGEWKEALRTRQCLVVLDDVWREADAMALVVRETSSAFLITTRIPRVVTSVDAHPCLVDEMELEQGVKLLAAAFPQKAESLVEKLRGLVERAGGWPVLLGLIAAQLRYKLSQQATPEQAIRQVVEDLQEFGLEAFDSRNPKNRDSAVRATLEASFRYLDESDPRAKEHYRCLAAFPDDETIPLEVAAEIWGVSQPQARRLAERFHDASLAKLDHQRGLTLHDVFVHYLQSTFEPSQFEALHTQLLSKWADVHALPYTYAWRWFGWHCVKAGAADRLVDALFDTSWLATKLVKTSVASLLSDYALAVKAAPAEARSLSLLAEAIEKSSHVLSAHPDQLPAQLFGRLYSGITDRLDNVIEQSKRKLADWPLVPESLSLHPVGSPLQRTLRGHRAEVLGAVVLRNGRLLSWSEDGTLRLWSTQGEPVRELRGHEGGVKVAVELRNGRLLSWSEDGTFRLWSTQGEPVRELRGHRGGVQGVAELGDGRLLSWSEDGTLRLWNAQGEPVRRLRGHERSVKGAVELRDGRLLSWSEDGTLRLWNVREELVRKLLGHQGGVTGGVELGDGRLLSWSRDKTLRLP